MNTDRYYSLSLKVSFFSASVNFLLSLVKLIIGILSQSIAILTDALHSFSDLITTMMVIFSIWISKKPPDKEHPFGHGRAEDITTLLISFLLFIIGLGFLYTSWRRLFVPKSIYITSLFVVIILFSSLVKLILGTFTLCMAYRIKSYLLKSDAFHHYLDSIVNFCVGIGLIGIKYGLLYLDAFLGIGLSLLIVIFSLKIVKRVINRLLGFPPSPSFYKKIESLVKEFPQIRGFHDLEVHSYGKNNVVIFHVEVEKDLSLEEAHTLADSLEKKIYQQGLGRAIVHVDLSKRVTRTRKKEVEKLMNRVVRFVRRIKGFHGVEILNLEDQTILNFHLLLDKSTSLEDTHKISHRISKMLKDKFSFSKVNIHVEPFR